MVANSGHVSGKSSAAALSFIVHEPKGIIEWVRDRSLFSNDLRYLIISDSEWCVLKTGWARYSLFLNRTG
jgi:hypothetical protein